MKELKGNIMSPVNLLPTNVNKPRAVFFSPCTSDQLGATFVAAVGLALATPYASLS